MTKNKMDLVQDNSTQRGNSEKDLSFDYISGVLSKASISVGRRYLYKIINKCVEDISNNEVIKEELYKEVNYLVNTIGYKKYISSINLPIPLEELLNKELKIKKPSYFSYSYMKYYMIKTYRELKKDIRLGNKVHLWVDLEPKQAEDYSNVEDTLTNYKSIMCRLSNKKYEKYKDIDTNEDAWVYTLNVALHTDVVDLSENKILIDKQFTKNVLKKMPKHNCRYAYLIPKTKILLKEYINNLPKDRKILFANSANNYHSVTNLRERVWKPLLKYAGIEKRVRLHDLRGSYIDIALNNNASIKFVQEQVGHSKAQTTLDVYAQNNKDMIDKAIINLDNVYNMDGDTDE